MVGCVWDGAVKASVCVLCFEVKRQGNTTLTRRRLSRLCEKKNVRKKILIILADEYEQCYGNERYGLLLASSAASHSATSRGRRSTAPEANQGEKR